MDYEYDIFISYAHIDNLTPGPRQIGWIENLHRALEVRLGQLLGRKPRIWRDPKLRHNVDFGQVIVKELLESAVLVSVLSPRYIKSDWCLKELKRFIEAAEQGSGLYINDQARLLKVVKTQVPREDHPPEMQKLLGYEFYTEDPNSDHPRECNRLYGANARRPCRDKLEDLASDIRDLLESPLAPSGATVYLAETSSDLNQQRDQIRRELKQHGHIVLPDGDLPLNGPDLTGLIQDELSRCTLSIHLVGESYGIVPEATDHSVIELQYEQAVKRRERDQDQDFSSLIWLPVDLEPQDERQQAFVDTLRHDPRGAELLQTTLEELKTEIQDKLAPPGKEEEPSFGDGPARIYLICDQRDLDDIVSLEAYLFDQNIQVITPLFEGDEADISEEHRDSLCRCDAVLIYYGRASEAWLRGKLRDLHKAPGYGRPGPIRIKAIYVAGPETPRKANYRNLEVDEVIKKFDDFSPDEISSFLAKIKQQDGPR